MRKQPAVRKDTRFVGLDVHADTIAAAVAEASGEVRSLGLIPNRPDSVRRLVKRLGPADRLKLCYEAGPTGYVLYWELTAFGVHCVVVAPTLVPVKSGDRVKTDRRDAQKLARSYRAGDVTPVWVPDVAQEALRDLARAKEAAKKDQLRARHRLQKSLLRHGRRPSDKIKPWTETHLAWGRRAVRFDASAQQTVLMDYLAEVDHVQEIAWEAQHRLHKRYRLLAAKGKLKQQVITAVARELLGFIWAIGVHVEKQVPAVSRKRSAA